MSIRGLRWVYLGYTLLMILQGGYYSFIHLFIRRCFYFFSYEKFWEKILEVAEGGVNNFGC